MTAEEERRPGNPGGQGEQRPGVRRRRGEEGEWAEANFLAGRQKEEEDGDGGIGFGDVLV